jgi:hypothetical protein
VNSYNLSFAVLLITAAAVGDRFGQDVRGRSGVVLGGLGGERAGARRRLGDRRARRPGRRRGLDHAAGAGAADGCVPAREARRGDRCLQRDHRAGGRERSAGGRRGGRGDRLAVDLLGQRADRARRGPAGADQDARELWAGHGPRPPRPRIDHRRRAQHRLGFEGRQRRRLGERGADRFDGGRRSAAGCVRRLGAAGARAAADAAVPVAQLLGRQHRDLLHVRVALRSRVLLRAAPPGWARLRAAGHRAAAAAVDGDLHHCRARRRRAFRPDRPASVR